MSYNESDVLYEIGAAGLSKAEGKKLIEEARVKSSKIHAMGAQGRVPIPGTTKVIVYDGGIDGWDASIFVEEAG